VPIGPTCRQRIGPGPGRSRPACLPPGYVGWRPRVAAGRTRIHPGDGRRPCRVNGTVVRITALHASMSMLSFEPPRPIVMGSYAASPLANSSCLRFCPWFFRERRRRAGPRSTPRYRRLAAPPRATPTLPARDGTTTKPPANLVVAASSLVIGHEPPAAAPGMALRRRRHPGSVRPQLGKPARIALATHAGHPFPIAPA